MICPQRTGRRDPASLPPAAGNVVRPMSIFSRIFRVGRQRPRMFGGQNRQGNESRNSVSEKKEATMNQPIQKLWRALFGITLVLIAWRAGAQSGPISQQIVGSNVAQQSPQALSQTGLLPIYALDLQLDPSWVDSTSAPSNSAEFSHNGINDTLQQAWETLRSGGFNMIRFPINVDDPRSVVRMVNLCVWARANSVNLIPILQGTATGEKDHSNAINVFISGVVSLMRQADPSLTPY